MCRQDAHAAQQLGFYFSHVSMCYMRWIGLAALPYKQARLMVLHGNCRRSCILGECMARQQAQKAHCLGPGGQILE